MKNPSFMAEGQGFQDSFHEALHVSFCYRHGMGPDDMLEVMFQKLQHLRN
jgi:hypothetical protein